MVREPVVAGTFYPADAEKLKNQIEECFLGPLGPGELPKINPRGKKEVLGLISPHAGYIYSGSVASYGISFLANDLIPSLVVIMGPNHTGMGADVSIQAEGLWRTPFGKVEIDFSVARAILENSSEAEEDHRAHALEHSIEVQLPFLQYVFGTDFKFVPICFLDQSLETCRDVGLAVAKTLGTLQGGGSSVIIASTDFTHYEDHDTAIKKDGDAIKAIQELSPEALLQTVRTNNISMCGPGPVAAMLFAAKDLGATEAELLTHKTSGDSSGDYHSVVGYASILVK